MTRSKSRSAVAIVLIPDASALDTISESFTIPDIQEAYDVLHSRRVRFEHEPSVVHKTEKEELWLAFPSGPR